MLTSYLILLPLKHNALHVRNSVVQQQQQQHYHHQYYYYYYYDGVSASFRIPSPLSTPQPGETFMSQQNNLPIISGVDKTPRGEVGAASIQNIIMCCGFFRTGLPSHSSIPDSWYEIRELLSLIVIGWLSIIESRGPPTCYLLHCR